MANHVPTERSPIHPSRGTLVALAGLPGTGKSSLGRALASVLDAAVLDKDVVRAALFAGDVDYSREQNDVCVRAMLETATNLLRSGRRRWVVLDGRTFTRRAHVDAVRAHAVSAQLELRWVECVCAPQVARARLAHDRAEGLHPAADRDPELHDRIASNAQELDEPKLVVRTDDGQTPTELATEVAHELRK